MEPSLTEQPDLRSLIQSLWRRKWLFLAIVVSIPAAVYAISLAIPKRYEATSLISIKTSNIAATVLSSATAPAAATDAAARLVFTEDATRRAAEQLGISPSASGSLGDRIVAEPIVNQGGQTTELLGLTAHHERAARAAEIANAFARAVKTVRTQEAVKEIDKAIGRLEAQSAASGDEAVQTQISQQLQELRAARLTQEDSTEIIQTAAQPGTPVSPHPRRNAALGGVVGLLLALGAVAAAERLDRRVRDPAELEGVLGAPLLSLIPRSAFPGERPAPGPVGEAFRTVAASLVYFNIDRQISTVMVASPTKGDGKTTVATYLAIALARDGEDVIIVDGDLRRPQVAVRLGIEPAAGLADVLTRQVDLDEALIEVDVGDGHVRVLGGGKPPPNPARLLGSERMDSLLDELSELADIVIIDTPPMLHVSDSVPLLERVSGTVVVARLGHTKRDALQHLRQVVERALGDILGSVATGGRSGGLYGYGYYGEEDGAEPPPGGTGEADAVADDGPEAHLEEDRDADDAHSASAEEASPKGKDSPAPTRTAKAGQRNRSDGKHVPKQPVPETEERPAVRGPSKREPSG